MGWKIGDIVKLKSGGPRMTVQETDGEYVTCQWFQDKKLERGTFQAESLCEPGPAASVVAV